MAPASPGEAVLLIGIFLLVATLGLPLLIALLSWGVERIDCYRAARAAEQRAAALRRSSQTEPAVVRVAPAAPLTPPAVVVRSTRQIPRPADVPAAPTVRRHAPITVRPVANLPLWQEKGWRQARPGVIIGEFQAAGRRWRGQIEMPYRDAYQAFIWHPPLRELDMHPHRACFQRNGHGPDCYHVHYGSMPSSLDHAITTVEAVLAEAVTRYGRGS